MTPQISAHLVLEAKANKETLQNVSKVLSPCEMKSHQRGLLSQKQIFLVSPLEGRGVMKELRNCYDHFVPPSLALNYRLSTEAFYLKIFDAIILAIFV